MRLILGLFPPSPPRIVPISPPRSLPRTGPRLRSRSRACFRVYPRAGLCIGPSLVFASVPVPAPVSVPAPRWFLSQSPHRPHFPSSVSAPYRSPPPLRFPRLFPCLPPRLFPCLPPRRSLSQSSSQSSFQPPLPFPLLFPCLPPVSAPRRSLSQSQSSFQPPLPFPLLYPCLPLCLLRAGLCPSPCLGLRPASVSPALRSVRSSFRVPKVACRTVVLLFPWIPLYSVLLLRFFYPASFLLSLCQGWNSCISKFLVVHLRKI